MDAVDNDYTPHHGDACTGFNTGKRRLFLPAWEYARTSPPDSLPPFLGLYGLQDVPDEYRPLVTE